jgi:beta-glucuronidase
VWVEALTGPGYVAGLQLLSVVEGANARLTVRAELMNLSERALNDTYTLYVDERPVKSGSLPLDPGGVQPVLLQVALSDVRLWSAEDPHLYHVRMAFAGDDLIERTGLRTIEVQGERLLLNGAPMRLWGLNRHEDHPDWGFALPEHLHLRDLDLVHNLGATAVRGSHYPNDPRFLDLCDERGLLFIEEIPLWGYGRQHLAQDFIGSRASAMLWAMISRDMHHPSIFAWSVLNECATDTHEGRAVVSDLVDVAHEIDPTRPVTYASNKGVDDICFDLVDIVCLNAYYGWYRHDLTWGEFLDRVRAKIGDKPMIVSEFGAGGIYGCHALEEDVLWSEEYQLKLIEECVALFLQRSDVAGFFVWQFFDTRTDRGERALRRPRSYNNKGLLDEYRRPKLAYHALRRMLQSAAQRLIDEPPLGDEP